MRAPTQTSAWKKSICAKTKYRSLALHLELVEVSVWEGDGESSLAADGWS